MALYKSIDKDNEAATIEVENPRYIEWIHFSYNAVPTDGYLQIALDDTTLYKQYITQGGPGPVPFADKLAMTGDGTLIITLAAGGAGVKGCLVASIN